MIVLPWPDKRLSPNARGHFMARSTAVKKARSDAFWATKAAGIHAPNTPRIRLKWSFNPPTAHKRDDDNLIGRCKAYRDGIADALGIDDSRFVTSVDIGEIVKGGRVTATVEAI